MIIFNWWERYTQLLCVCTICFSVFMLPSAMQRLRIAWLLLFIIIDCLFFWPKFFSKHSNVFMVMHGWKLCHHTNKSLLYWSKWFLESSPIDIWLSYYLFCPIVLYLWHLSSKYSFLAFSLIRSATTSSSGLIGNSSKSTVLVWNAFYQEIFYRIPPHNSLTGEVRVMCFFQLLLEKICLWRPETQMLSVSSAMSLMKDYLTISVWSHNLSWLK